jgi:hypothetical protein
MMLVPFSGDPAVGLGAMVGYLTHWIFPFVLGYGIIDAVKLRRSLWIYFILFSAVLGLSLLAYFGLFPKVVNGNFFLVEDGLLKAGRSHIALGALCVFIVFFLAGKTVYSVESGFRRFWPLIPAAIYLLALALSGSRGYYIAGAVAFVSFGAVYALKRGMVKYLLLALALSAAAGLLIYKFNPSVNQRINRTGLADQNVSERLYLYRVAAAEIKARPFFGYGPGQAIKQKEYFDRLPEAERSLNRHPALHSFYLNLAADFGLAGFAIFVIIMAYIFRGLAVIMKDKASPVNYLAFGLFWGLVGFLTGDCFDTLLRGPGVAMELFWVCGMVFRVYREEKLKGNL